MLDFYKSPCFLNDINRQLFKAVCSALIDRACTVWSCGCAVYIVRVQYGVVCVQCTCTKYLVPTIVRCTPVDSLLYITYLDPHTFYEFPE